VPPPMMSPNISSLRGNMAASVMQAASSTYTLPLTVSAAQPPSATPWLDVGSREVWIDSATGPLLQTQ
jgi:hypothetical protein